MHTFQHGDQIVTLLDLIPFPWKSSTDVGLAFLINLSRIAPFWSNLSFSMRSRRLKPPCISPIPKSVPLVSVPEERLQAVLRRSNHFFLVDSRERGVICELEAPTDARPDSFPDYNHITRPSVFTSFPLPTAIGLNRIIRRNQGTFFEQLRGKISGFLQDYADPNRPVFSDDINNRVDVFFNEDSKPLLLLAVSGSGKTKHLEAFLSRNWGFYLDAGNLSARSSSAYRTDEHQLLTARRNGYSKDLHWLHHLIQQYSHQFEPCFDEGACGNWARILLYSRMSMLAIFLEQLGALVQLLRHECG